MPLDVEDHGEAVPLQADAGKAVHRRVSGRMRELLRIDPELPPAHRRDLFADDGDQALAIGFRLLAGDERALIDAVHRPIGRDLRADDAGEGREPVVDGNHLVADARLDLSRPLDHADGADRTFQRVAELAAERAVRAGRESNGPEVGAAALSEIHITIVLSSTPAALMASSTWPVR